MGHDKTKVLLGGIRSSFKVVNSLRTAVTILAGLCVFSKSDGTYNAIGEGSPRGISLGNDLSQIGATCVVDLGLEVPLKLKAAFTPAIGAQVFIEKTTGLGIAEDTVGETTVGINAMYMPAYVGASTALLSGIPEDGSAEVPVALIDLKGGV